MGLIHQARLLYIPHILTFQWTLGGIGLAGCGKGITEKETKARRGGTRERRRRNLSVERKGQSSELGHAGGRKFNPQGENSAKPLLVSRGRPELGEPLVRLFKVCLKIAVRLI